MYCTQPRTAIDPRLIEEVADMDTANFRYFQFILIKRLNSNFLAKERLFSDLVLGEKYV